MCIRDRNYPLNLFLNLEGFFYVLFSGSYLSAHTKQNLSIHSISENGRKKSLSEWQTAYHERMSSRWNQLERGQSSMETKRKHVPTWLYKLGGRLDKQYEEIVSALSDINAFNAGKKRDKALELIAAWLPDVEKFSKEISKQSAYINSLKEQIGQESDYAGRMRDEKYEQELKVQKANQKIFELQRTNEQMGRLLSKIPPEVLEELQKNHKSNHPRRLHCPEYGKERHDSRPV